MEIHRTEKYNNAVHNSNKELPGGAHSRVDMAEAKLHKPDGSKMNHPSLETESPFLKMWCSTSGTGKVITGSVLVLSEFQENNMAEKVLEEIMVENSLNLTKATNINKIQELGESQIQQTKKFKLRNSH